MSRIAFLVRTLRERLAWSPALTRIGFLGVALGAACALAAAVRGPSIPPEGTLLDTATFNVALGFFLLTIVVLASGVPWTPAGKRRWIGWEIGLTLYAYGIETVQAFRGLDPRFSQVAGSVDQMLGGVFFLVALALMGLFIIVVLKYFRTPATPIVAAVRYGAAASFVAYGVGIVMSVATQGRHVGEAGNLMLLHALGFHGVQAIPLLAVLLHWAGVPTATAMRHVHVAGIAWLGACIAIAWQSGSGRTLAMWSAASAAAGILLLVWCVEAAGAAQRWLTVSLPHGDTP